MIVPLLFTGRKKSTGVLNLDYTGNSITVDGTTYANNVAPFDFNLYNPSSLWYNGKQYITWRRSHISSDGEPVIAVWDGTNLTVRVVSEASGVALNYHNNTTLIIDDSGYIYIVIEQHGTAPQIYKSNSTENVSAFTKLTHDLGWLDYPKITYVSGQGFLAFGRTAGTYHLKSAVSADAQTWTTWDMSAVTPEAGEPDTRHYPYIGINWVKDGYAHVTVNKRTYDGISLFLNVRGWKLKTPLDANMGKVWYNDQETFSKDISSSGVLTEVELNTNCLMWYAPANKAQEGSGVYIDKYYSHQRKTDLSQNRLLYINGTWQDNLLYAGYLLNYDNELWAIGDPGTGIRLRKMNMDGTIASEGKLFDLPPTGIIYQGAAYNYMFSIPFNMDDIPKGSKFLICAQSNKDGSYNRDSATQNDVVCWEILKKT